MLRAVAKWAVLAGFGRLPRGPAIDREITRSWMGTQATHVDKLARVWPGYVRTWTERAKLGLDGLDIWVHEPGWTPFPLLAAYLLTGRPAAATILDGRIHDRYLARAVAGVLSALPGTPNGRRDLVDALRWCSTAAEALDALGAVALRAEDPGRIPLPSASRDLCHSGGVLEHYRPDRLAAFLAECHRILRPGGVASHVLDHRDHLYHADRSLPYLAHLALPEGLYHLLHGHALGYHNRLPPIEVAALFEAAGFEAIAVRRHFLADGAYTDDERAYLSAPPGLDRRRLAPRHRGIAETDLRTAACHYLYRKPDRNRLLAIARS